MCRWSAGTSAVSSGPGRSRSCISATPTSRNANIVTSRMTLYQRSSCRAAIWRRLMRTTFAMPSRKATATRILAHSSSSVLMACQTVGSMPRATSGAGAKKAAVTSRPQITVRMMGISRFTPALAEDALVDVEGAAHAAAVRGRHRAQPRAREEQHDCRDLAHVARADGAHEAGLAREVGGHGEVLLAHDRVVAGGHEGGQLLLARGARDLDRAAEEARLREDQRLGVEHAHVDVRGGALAVHDARDAGAVRELLVRQVAHVVRDEGLGPPRVGATLLHGLLREGHHHRVLGGHDERRPELRRLPRHVAQDHHAVDGLDL